MAGLQEIGITGARAEHILKVADRYKREGFGAQEAHERAIADVLKESESEQQSVLKQMNKGRENKQ
jgi:hypothetical protein